MYLRKNFSYLRVPLDGGGRPIRLHEVVPVERVSDVLVAWLCRVRIWCTWEVIIWVSILPPAFPTHVRGIVRTLAWCPVVSVVSDEVVFFLEHHHETHVVCYALL